MSTSYGMYTKNIQYLKCCAFLKEVINVAILFCYFPVYNVSIDDVADIINILNVIKVGIYLIFFYIDISTVSPRALDRWQVQIVCWCAQFVADTYKKNI